MNNSVTQFEGALGSFLGFQVTISSNYANYSSTADVALELASKNISQFINDSGYITSLNTGSSTTANYAITANTALSLSNHNVSQFVNDSGYITSRDVGDSNTSNYAITANVSLTSMGLIDNNISQFLNDAGYITTYNVNSTGNSALSSTANYALTANVALLALVAENLSPQTTNDTTFLGNITFDKDIVIPATLNVGTPGDAEFITITGRGIYINPLVLSNNFPYIAVSCLTASVSATSVIPAMTPLQILSDFSYVTCDATIYGPCRGLNTKAGTGNMIVLTEGIAYNSDWSWVGGDIFLATNGGMTQTPATGAGNIYQYLGYALGAHAMYFKPSFETMEFK